MEEQIALQHALHFGVVERGSDSRYHLIVCDIRLEVAGVDK